MLLYYSSLEEKFKVYREQQMLELKAQENQLIQAMIARDPALAERFIEAKPEAKPEVKTQTPSWPTNEQSTQSEKKSKSLPTSPKEKRGLDLINELNIQIAKRDKGLSPVGSRSGSRSSSTTTSPTASEARTVSSSDATQGGESEQEVSSKWKNKGEYLKAIKTSIDKLDVGEDAKSKWKKDLNSLLKNNKTYADINNYVAGNIVKENRDKWEVPTKGSGLRTRRCKVHF